MKKLLSIFIIAASFLLTGNHSYAQAITSHAVVSDSSCGHVSISTNTSGCAAGQYLRVFFGDGASAICSLSCTGSAGFGSTGHSYAATGSYTIKLVLYTSTAAMDSVIFSQPVQYCRNLPIGAYLDGNANCVRDGGEPYITVPLLVKVDSAGVPIDTISMLSGAYYQAFGAVGTAYSFTLLSPPGGLALVCPTSGILNFTVAASGIMIPTQYYALQCGSTTAFDLGVSATFRPAIAGGGANKASIVVGNSSCSATAAQLKFEFSPKYTFSNLYPSTLSHTVTGTSVLVDVGSVSNASPVSLTIALTPVVALTLGDSVNTKYTVTPITGDAYPANNVVIRCDTVRAAYDPNAKSVTPTGAITAGTRLEYMLQFENDGNDTAYNIHILDTLSGYLDVNTLQLITSTHAVNVLSYTKWGNNILKFDFPDIRLPDSSHHDYCRGAVVFSINAKTTLSPGATISNRVGIYFDTNPVVMTNTVYSSIPLPTSVNNMQMMPVEVYPNPVKDVLNVRIPDGAYSKATIYNVLGQAVSTHEAHSGTQSLDVHALSPGIYYLNLKGAAGSRAIKFEKQ